jgi:lipopolysaccharide export LptBFGC system permease protein LptF
MRRRIRLLPVMIVLACLAVAFFWFGSRLDAKLEEADQLYQQAVASGSALETPQNALKARWRPPTATRSSKIRPEACTII